MKIGPAAELEARLALIVEEAARDVARQEVGRELDALEAEVEGLGHEAGDERLGQARVVLDEDVPVGEDAGQDLLEHVRLADDHLAERGEDVLAAIGDGVDLHARLSISAMSLPSAPSDGPAPADPAPPGRRRGRLRRRRGRAGGARGSRRSSGRLRVLKTTSSRSPEEVRGPARAPAAGAAARRGATDGAPRPRRCPRASRVDAAGGHDQPRTPGARPRVATTAAATRYTGMTASTTSSSGDEPARPRDGARDRLSRRRHRVRRSRSPLRISSRASRARSRSRRPQRVMAEPRQLEQARQRRHGGARHGQAPQRLAHELHRRLPRAAHDVPESAAARSNRA